MKITELKVSGFKSFVDPVRLEIASGLTGIVGPNGCGKSNVLESLRWVMGASSARALRGAAMDDVIFSGTDKRPPRDIADVTITIDNKDKKAPAPFEETPILEVSRKIKRASGSSYKINGKEVRARDVQLLFADASTGANSPALVRQGQISELISAKPENRRRILEEAAGIAGLYTRRHEAELRLNATSINLEKLDMVLENLEEQLRHLNRQARQAERYRAIAEEIRALEAYDLYLRHDEIAADVKEAEGQLRQIELAIAAATVNASGANRAVIDAENSLPQAQQEQSIAEAIVRRIDGQRHQFEREKDAALAAIEQATRELARIDADNARESARIEDADANIAQLNIELANLAHFDKNGLEAELNQQTDAQTSASQALATAEATRNHLIAEIAQLEGEKKSLEQSQQAAAGHLTLCQNRLNAAQDGLAAREKNQADDGALQAAILAVAQTDQAASAAMNMADQTEQAENLARQEEAQTQSAYRAASGEADKLGHEINALKALLARAQSNMPNPALAQIKAKPGYELAVATGLGEDAQASLNIDAARAWHGASVRPIDWPSNVTPLLDVVTAPTALAARLSAIGVYDGPADKAPFAQLAAGARLVSKNGDLWRWDGYVRRAGAPGPEAIALQQKNRLLSLEEQASATGEKAQTALAAFEAAKTSLAMARAAAASARSQVPAKIAALVSAKEAKAKLELSHQASHDQIIAAQTLVAQRQEEVGLAQQQLADIASKIEALSPTANLARHEKRELLDAEIAILRERANLAIMATERTRAKGQEWASAMAKAQEGLKAWQKRAQEAKGQIKALEMAHFAASNQLEGAKIVPAQCDEKLKQCLENMPAAQARLRAANDRIASAEQNLRTAREEDRAKSLILQNEREAAAAARARLELLKDNQTRIAGEMNQASLENIEALKTVALGFFGEKIANFTRQTVFERLDKANKDRDGLGGVNLTAEDEAAQVKTRLDDLSAEKKELTQTVAKLRHGVDEINAEGKERLIAAFDVVHGHFRILFETLFGGGHAELRLTESDDPLGGGLEIFACPPGKRLQSMSLMSGGEQALTAAALIFAVFLSNPAPVCVLDEVDAPLDDANVERFCILLEEMRQRTDTRFLVITHHPITMARMDRLFGVTMAERGVSQVVAVDLKKAEKLIAHG